MTVTRTATPRAPSPAIFATAEVGEPVNRSTRQVIAIENAPQPAPA